MCTAVTYQTKDFYFGRTLDYDCSYGEEVVVTPRRFPLPFQQMGTLESHYAIIGMAHVAEGFPLYYDACNEKGLAMAGLNFVGNACYGESVPGKDNIAQFEFLPWILSQCDSVTQARQKLQTLNLANASFSDRLPSASLHWMIADREEAITVEAVAEGLFVYDNPTGVLTNNPPFPTQLFSLNNYQHISPRDPVNTFCPALPLQCHSRGMGGLGLPGDLSSQSRFVRAAFTRLNSRSADTEAESVSQFFHILGAVEQTRGCCELPGGAYEITIYTSCCNATKGIYYYSTYENRRLTAVSLHEENLDAGALVCYPLRTASDVLFENATCPLTVHRADAPQKKRPVKILKKNRPK